MCSVASFPRDLNSLCSPMAVPSHLCSGDVTVSCRKYSQYHLGMQDSKCKTLAFRKINGAGEGFSGSL